MPCVRPRDGDDDALGLLGNDVLKRCETVLDNREGAVYLRPTGHADDRYRNPERRVIRVSPGLLLAAAAAVGLRRALRHSGSR